MQEILQNPYVVAGLIAAILVIVWKVIDQRRDARQAVYQDIADAFDKFGQDQFAAAFKALARDGYEKFFSLLANLADRLKRPGGVAEVLCTIIVKSIRDPEFRADPSVKAKLDPVLAEMALGFLLDDATQAEMTRLSTVLAEYGSVEFANLMSNLGANRLSDAKKDFHALITLLRNKERLDDEFVKRAEKLLPAVVKADPAHYATLKRIMDAIPAPTVK